MASASRRRAKRKASSSSAAPFAAAAGAAVDFRRYVVVQSVENGRWYRARTTATALAGVSPRVVVDYPDFKNCDQVEEPRENVRLVDKSTYNKWGRWRANGRAQGPDKKKKSKTTKQQLVVLAEPVPDVKDDDLPGAIQIQHDVDVKEDAEPAVAVGAAASVLAAASSLADAFPPFSR